MVQEDYGPAVGLNVSLIAAFLASESIGVLAFLGDVAHLVALETSTGIAGVMAVVSKAKHAFDWFLLKDAVFDGMTWFSAAIASRIPHSFFLLETIKVSHGFPLFFLIFFLGLHDIRIPVFPPSFFLETFDPLLKI